MLEYGDVLLYLCKYGDVILYLCILKCVFFLSRVFSGLFLR